MSLGQALGLVGGIVGNMIAPGIGGAIGFMAGTLLGNLLDPPKIEGPRLNDLKLQTSEYGRPIPILYGTMRMSGNCIWQTDLVEHKNVEGGKGGPEVTNYTYSASFAIALCEGEIDGIVKVFADGRLVWSEEDSAATDFAFTLYTGTETQEPDPTMEAEIGVGLVPAHRGIAYVVFEDLMLGDFGNRIPQLEFVVSTEPATASLRIVNANYATGSDTGSDSAYNYSGSPTTPIPQWFSGMPIIVDWPPSGDIIVAANTLAATYLVAPQLPHAFSQSDLSCTDSSASTAVEFPSFNNAAGHTGLGIHVLADGTEVALWHTNAPSDDIGTTAQVYAALAVTPDAPAYANFLTEAGVPGAEYLCAAAITQDGTKFFAFTSTTSSAGNASKWYRIEDATVAEQGTVNAGALFALAWGNNAKPHGVGNPGERNGHEISAENNGRYFWNLTSDDVRLYYIDDAGDFDDWTGGTINCGIDNNDGVEASIQTLHSEGYAGVFRGNSLVLLTRLGSRPGIALSEIVSRISSKTTLDVAEYDTTDLTDIVPGYLVTAQMEARNAIQPLRQAYFFDAVEVDGVVTFIKRGGASVVTIDSDDLAARPDQDEAPAVLRTVRVPEAELPKRVYVEYVNAEFDYQAGTQYDERQVTASESQTTVSLPISLSDQTAKGIAGAHVWGAYQERESYTWYTSRKYARYVPTDVVTVEGMTLRVTNVREAANKTIEWTGVVSRAELYDIPESSPGVGSSSPGQTSPAARVATEAVLLDIPILSQNDAPFGFYAALGPAADGAWPGATLYKSVDGGYSYAAVKSASVPSIIGTVAEALSATSGGSPTATLTVTLTDDDATLSSCNATALANGANLFALRSGSGWEFCQFQNATLTGTKTYEITVDVRGARETTDYQAGHAAGDTFVLLSSVYNVDAPESELNVALWYKAVTLGNTLASAIAFQFTNTGIATTTFYEIELDNLGVFVGDNSGSPTTTPHKGLVPAPQVGDGAIEAVLMATNDSGSYWGVPSWAGSGGGSPSAGGSITIRDEGITLTSAASIVDFVGAGVAATYGAGVVTVTISGGGLTPIGSPGPAGVWGGTSYIPVLTVDDYGRVIVATQTPFIGRIQTYDETNGLVDADAIELYFEGDGIEAYDAGSGVTNVRVNAGAPKDATYIVREASGSLTNECTLIAGAGITITEGGGSPATSLTIASSVGDGATSQSQEFTSSGAFTCYLPASVTAIRVTAIAAGGGGSTRAAAIGGAGGGSGEQVMSFVMHFDGGSPNTVTGIVGAKGTGAAAGGGAAAGNPGGDTIIYCSGATVTARGGLGGTSAGVGGAGGGFRGGAGGGSANPGGAGVAGTAEAVTHFGGGGGGGGGSTTGANGGLGAPSGGYDSPARANAASTQGGGGGGADSPWGLGGAGGGGGAAGNNAASTSYGAGGGGAGGLTGNTAAGGNGCDGYVLIEYVAAP